MRNPYGRLLPVTLAAAALFVAGCASTQTETKPESKAVAETKPAAPATGQAAAPSAGASAMASTSYNVVRGDHLWGISSKPTIYGNPYQWPLIFKANRDKIQDADLIEPGQVLSVEKNPSSGDVSAAVAHAKSRGAWSLNSTESTDVAYLRGYNLK